MEDEEPAAAAVVGWLTQAGYQVDWFRRGAECARAVERGLYSACLLDWMVPDLTGPAVMARLQLQRKEAPLPVIFLSGRDSEEDVVQILSAGADDYIVKPVSRPVLLARLGAVLRRSGLVQDSRSAIGGDWKWILLRGCAFWTDNALT